MLPTILYVTLAGLTWRVSVKGQLRANDSVVAGNSLNNIWRRDIDRIDVWRIRERQPSRTPVYPILFKITPNINISCIQCASHRGHYCDPDNEFT